MKLTDSEIQFIIDNLHKIGFEVTSKGKAFIPRSERQRALTALDEYLAEVIVVDRDAINLAAAEFRDSLRYYDVYRMAKAAMAIGSLTTIPGCCCECSPGAKNQQ